MLYHVAVATGTWDVIGLRRRMSAKQLAGWRAYYALHKFGPVGGNYHAAVVAKAVYDAGGVRRKDGQPWSYDDFLLREPEPVELKPEAKPEVGWQTSLAIAHVIARAQNHIAAGGK